MNVPFEGFRFGVETVPKQFFSELLPAIDDLDELRAALFGIFLLNQFSGDSRYIVLKDFLELPSAIEAFGGADAERRLKKALAKAVERKIFLRVRYNEDDLYFLNSPKGKAALKRLGDGEWVPDSFLHLTEAVNVDRPNIFTLYEENIGPLTPLIADRLKDAEARFRPDWIAAAIEQAVVNNARSWRYIETILANWKENGRNG